MAHKNGNYSENFPDYNYTVLISAVLHILFIWKLQVVGIYNVYQIELHESSTTDQTVKMHNL